MDIYNTYVRPNIRKSNILVMYIIFSENIGEQIKYGQDIMKILTVKHIHCCAQVCNKINNFCKAIINWKLCVYPIMLAQKMYQ